MSHHHYGHDHHTDTNHFMDHHDGTGYNIHFDSNGSFDINFRKTGDKNTDTASNTKEKYNKIVDNAKKNSIDNLFDNNGELIKDLDKQKKQQDEMQKKFVLANDKVSKLLDDPNAKSEDVRQAIEDVLTLEKQIDMGNALFAYVHHNENFTDGQHKTEASSSIEVFVDNYEKQKSAVNISFNIPPGKPKGGTFHYTTHDRPIDHYVSATQKTVNLDGTSNDIQVKIPVDKNGVPCKLVKKEMNFYDVSENFDKAYRDTNQKTSFFGNFSTHLWNGTAGAVAHYVRTIPQRFQRMVYSRPWLSPHEPFRENKVDRANLEIHMYKNYYQSKKDLKIFGYHRPGDATTAAGGRRELSSMQDHINELLSGKSVDKNPVYIVKKNERGEEVATKVVPETKPDGQKEDAAEATDRAMKETKNDPNSNVEVHPDVTEMTNKINEKLGKMNDRLNEIDNSNKSEKDKKKEKDEEKTSFLDYIKGLIKLGTIAFGIWGVVSIIKAYQDAHTGCFYTNYKEKQNAIKLQTGDGGVNLYENLCKQNWQNDTDQEYTTTTVDKNKACTEEPKNYCDTQIVLDNWKRKDMGDSYDSSGNFKLASLDGVYYEWQQTSFNDAVDNIIKDIGDGLDPDNLMRLVMKWLIIAIIALVGFGILKYILKASIHAVEGK